MGSIDFDFEIPNIHYFMQVCKEWNYGIFLSSDCDKIWLGLIRTDYPIAESLAKIINLDPLNIRPIFWKFEYMKQHFYSHPYSLYASSSPDLAPHGLSSYIFQVDLICHLRNSPRNSLSDLSSATTAIYKFSHIVHGGVDAIWDVDNLRLNLGADVGSKLNSIDIDKFDIKVHAIGKRSGMRILLFQGEPEDWVDDNLFFFGNFSPPRYASYIYSPFP